MRRPPESVPPPAPRATRWSGRAWALYVALCLLPHAQAVSASQFGEPVVTVVVEQAGRVVSDPVVERLVGDAVGRPLSMREVSDTVKRLMSLGRFEDVQPHAEPADGGVQLRYVLFPLYPVDRVEFQGALGLRERDLRRIVTERFGDVPSGARAAEVADALVAAYRSRGFPDARVAPRLEETRDPDRATLVLQVQSGARATIRDVVVRELDGAEGVVAVPDVRRGQPYDAIAIEAQLDRYLERMRSRGYYEARATHAVDFEPDGLFASVTLDLSSGPRVVVAFAGDALSASERERLVPIRAEGSADEDLLEDGVLAIEDHLFARGYADARVGFSREERPGQVVITFLVERGARHVVDGLQTTGNVAMTDAELQDLIQVRQGDPFVQRTLDNGVALAQSVYRTRGFTRVQVTPAVVDLLPERPGDPHRIQVAIAVDEGPQTIVRSIAFQGVAAFDDEHLRALMATAPGSPYSELAVLEDRDRVDLEYRNSGFESVVVQPQTTVADDGTAADILFSVSEGPQIFVDYIIIVGNRRTSLRTIERELLLRSGEPLGFSALIESRSRLMALGLFRRVQIEQLVQSTETRRDVVVQLEEAPPNSLAFGPGLEGGFRLRPGTGGTAQERFEVAPRGFFEVGRRNLWGKNRSVNLFTRVSLRSRDLGFEQAAMEEPGDEGRYGFNEYRVLATFREPRAFGTRAELMVTGIFDQAIRSSFNFITREARAEMGLRLSPRYTMAGRYSIKRTELFDERFTEEEKPLIDRLFPQVRLSKFAGSLIHDTRDEPLDPTNGTFIILDGDIAARAIGSEVGFVKTYVQAFTFRRLPTARRTVLALGSRVGVAHGFPRQVPGIDQQGQPIVETVQDLPASERFFAGGDTSVRGFALDRLGSAQTISPVTGFPTGGNSVVVLNAELRVALFGALQGVGFLDAGNVYPRTGDLDLLDLRPAAGFGIWYRSPVGPIRLDVGFNLDPREFADRRERRTVLHVSLGPAF